MDLQLLSGLNIPMLLSIVFIVAMIKQATKGKLKGWMVFVHLAVTAVVIIFITSPLTVKPYFANLIMYSAITGYGYDFLKNGAFDKFGDKFGKKGDSGDSKGTGKEV